jgi:sodium-dependent dicarboxylate transporter 2/3/5
MTDPDTPSVVVVESPPWRLRAATLAVAVGLLATGFFVAPPDGLSVEGFRAILLIVSAILLWVFQPVDLAVTSLLGMAAIPVLGIVPARSSFELFGNQAVFFVLGVFVLAAVLMQSGLATRAALTLLARFDDSPARLANAVLVMSIVGCAFLVSHAVAAILFPILLEICRALGLPHKQSPFARRLMLSMSWGTIVGSNLTFLSSVRVGLALGLLDQHAARVGGGDGVSFGFWMLGSSVVVALMAVAVAVVLHVSHPPEPLDMRPAVALLRGRVAAMGAVSRDEWVALASLVLMLVGMVAYGQTLGFGTIALLAAGVNFVFGRLGWEAIEKYVSWGIVLLFGGAVAMASALEKTGGVTWVVEHVLAGGALGPLALVAVIAYCCVVMTEFASNSAVIAAIMPIAMVLADRAHLPARVMVFATVIPAGLAFMLPTGTPAMAMVFSSGYLRSRDTVLPGLVLIHLGWLAVLAAAAVWWPIIGLVPR